MKKLGLLAVGVPLLVMLGWFGTLVQARYTSEPVELKITGYDPRDLLSGHFVQYRVDYGDDRGCPGNYDYRPICKCLSPAGDGLHKAAWTGACEELNPASCPLFIRGDCRSGMFLAGIERMYFPESLAGKLARVPDKSTIRVAVSKDGSAQVLTLLIDGVEFQKALSDKAN